MTRYQKYVLPICLALAVLPLATWLLYPSGPSQVNAAMAEYQIEKMTCGSCIGNIEGALTGLDGVAAVEIDLTGSRGRVTYDPETIDSRVIGETITRAGYPAKLRLQLDSREYAALQQEESQLGQQYLARIGDRLLSRSDFEKLVRLRGGDAAPTAQNDQLRKSVWQEVLQRELLLAAAGLNQVVVQDGEVEVRLDELRQGHKGFDQLVAERYGSLADFRERLREEMIINRNFEEHVYAGVNDPGQRQVKLQQWYAELQNNTEVVIFDPSLKTVSQGSGGCACCNG